MYDVVIVGAGPAGLTAALYALRNGKSAVILEQNGIGGQITYSPKVENIPGFASVSGNEFADAFFEQVVGQGGEVELARAERLEQRICEGCGKPVWDVLTDDGQTFTGKAVVLALGVRHRMLGLPGEADCIGEGISFCAVCDGDFYKGKEVVLAGGGNSALQEAILLAGKVNHLTVLQDLPHFTGEAKLQEILFAKENVTKRTNMKITRLVMENGTLKGIAAVEQTTGTEELFPCDGFFEAIGLIPQNEAFRSLADLNDYGYFDSDESCATKSAGIFVAGDCRSKTVRQVATACSDGATAALAACRYIDAL